MEAWEEAEEGLGLVRPRGYGSLRDATERADRRSRFLVLLVAVAASVLALLAVTKGAGTVHNAGSPGDYASALAELKILTRSSASGLDQSSLAKQLTGTTGLAPSRTPLEKEKPGQYLAQILAQGRHATLPMLTEKEVKRSLACPLGMRCSFGSAMALHEHVEVTEYESSGKEGDEAAENTKSSDMSTGIQMWFDVYETADIGCTEDHVVYAIKFTKVVEKPVAVTEDGHPTESHDPGPDEEAKLMDVLNVFPFYVLQDLETGLYIDFVAPSDENDEVLDMKRGLFKELNPVFSTSAATSVGPAGEKLFMHYEHDINGRQPATVMLRQDAHGRTETQHIRMMLTQDDVQEAQAAGDGGDRCPYPTPDASKSIGQHTKTAKSTDGAVESSEDSSKIEVGKDPKKVTETSAQAAEDEEASGQRPAGDGMEIDAQYEIHRTAASPQPRVCTAETSVLPTIRHTGPLESGAAAGAKRQALARWRANVGQLAPSAGGFKRGLEHSDGSVKLVARPYTADPLHDAEAGTAARVVGPAEAHAAVQALIRRVGEGGKGDARIGTQGMSELKDVCSNHQQRALMFEWLATAAAASPAHRRTVTKFMGACGSLLAGETDRSTQATLDTSGSAGLLAQLSALIDDANTTQYVREQGLYAMVDLDCPSYTTLERLTALGRNHPTSRLGETATLVLGALLRKNRFCHEGTPATASANQTRGKLHSKIVPDDRHAAGSVFEAVLNAQLAAAVRHRDTDAAETTLLAMANSGSAGHLFAVARSLQANTKLMKGYELKHAVKTCLKSIGSHGGGPAHADAMELLETFQPATTQLATVDKRVVKSPEKGREKTWPGEWKADIWFASAAEGEKFLRLGHATQENSWRQFFVSDFWKVFSEGNPDLIKDAGMVALYNPASFEHYVKDATNEKFWVGVKWSGKISFKQKGTYTFRVASGGGASMLDIFHGVKKPGEGIFRLTHFQKSVFQWFTPVPDFAIKNTVTGVVRNYGNWYLGTDDEMTEGQTLLSRSTDTIAATFSWCNLYVYKTYEMAEMWSTKTEQASKGECSQIKEAKEEEFACNMEMDVTEDQNADACRSIKAVLCAQITRTNYIEMVLNEDGTLGMYHKGDEVRAVPLWSVIPTSKYPKSTTHFFRVMLEGNGELVLYSYPNVNKDKSGSSRFTGSERLWGSAREGSGKEDETENLDWSALLEAGRHFLESGSAHDTLTSDQCLMSQNEMYELKIVKADSNTNQGSVATIFGKPLLWRTELSNNPDCKLTITETGDMRIMKYPPSKSTKTIVWKAYNGYPEGMKEQGPFSMVLQRDGTLVIFNAVKEPQWTSGQKADGDTRYDDDTEENKEDTAVFVHDMNHESVKRTMHVPNNDDIFSLRLMFGGMLAHSSIVVEYSGPDTDNEWMPLPAYIPAKTLPPGKDVNLHTLVQPPEITEDEETEDEEDEDPEDPASCQGGEDPLVCYGKRIPEAGAVLGLLTLDAGKAEAKESSGAKQCMNYGFIRGEASAEVYTGMPWDGWDPWVINILTLEGRYLLGRKCKCGKINQNTCPTKKECIKAGKWVKPAKVGKSDGKKKIGGHFSIFGFVLKKFGKLSLDDPYTGEEPGGVIPRPPDFSVSAGTFGSTSGIEATETPVREWGVCGFQEDEYSLSETETTKSKGIPGIDKLGFQVGPVRVSIGATINMALGGEIGVTANHQEPEQLANGIKAECADGGRSGQGTSYLRTSLKLSGNVAIVIAKGSLGLELTFFSAQATGNVELLQKGFGKEAYVGFQAVKGEIYTALELRSMSTSWRCLGYYKVGQKRCKMWWPDVRFDWYEAWRKKIWGWKSPRMDSGNLLCDGLTDVGCAEFEENVGAKLYQILRTVDAFVEAAKALEEDVRNNNLEREKEETSRSEAQTVLSEAKRQLESASQDLEKLQSRHQDLERLVSIEERNIRYWKDHSNSLYYQFRKFDQAKLPQRVCLGRTLESIANDPGLRQLPAGVSDRVKREEPTIDLDNGHTNPNSAKALLGQYHDGSGTFINSEGVATPSYQAGGAARRRLLSSSSPPAASESADKVAHAEALLSARKVEEGEAQAGNSLPSESVAALKHLLAQSLHLSPDQTQDLDSQLKDEEIDVVEPEESNLKEADQTYPARTEELGWRQRQRQKWQEAARARREKRIKKAEERRVALEKWLHEKNLAAAARQLAYSTSPRRILANLEVAGARNAVKKGQQAIEKYDAEGNQKSWFRTTADAALDAVDKAYKKCENAKQHYRDSWLYREDKDILIAAAEKVRMEAVRIESFFWKAIYKDAQAKMDEATAKYATCKWEELPRGENFQAADTCYDQAMQLYNLANSEEATLQGREKPPGLEVILNEEMERFARAKRKLWTEGLQPYNMFLEAYAGRLWAEFETHHNEEDPCFFVQTGSYSGVDDYCYQTSLTAASCLVMQHKYNADLTQRTRNIEQAETTIATCKAEIAGLTEPGGFIDRTTQEISVRVETVTETTSTFTSWDDKVRDRLAAISGLQTTIRTYNTAKRTWEQAKTQVEQFLSFVGMCAYQEVDPISGRRMRMLYQLPPKDSPNVKLAQASARGTGSELAQEQTAPANHFPPGSAGYETDCAYIDHQGADYRGLADHAGDGTPCLPWPVGYTSRFLDAGLAKDITDCKDLVDGSSCWESCKAREETNSFCRNPQDAAGPYCRTGGTNEAPEFSACTQLTLCQDTGCTHDQPDASDYTGMAHHTEEGLLCLQWDQFPDFAALAVAGGWGNACRNPGGEYPRTWCFTEADGTKGYCNVGRQCPQEAFDYYDDDDELAASGMSSAASLSAASSKSGANARRVSLMYERQARAAHVELLSQMQAMGHSIGI
mmetsp:Transcript_59625/g.122265  ORF Transcript_59625/g.122265 Transcript_59625/m.122265 type:complete len:2837 (+) Transcript_59625:263-8773(+)